MAATLSSTTRPRRPEYAVKVAKSKDEVEACFDLRVEVFVVEQGFPLETEYDEYDSESVHILLTTPVSSPPNTSTSSITPVLHDIASTILPESLQPAEPSTSASDKPASAGPAHTQKPIGTIRYTPHLGKLSRLVVLEKYRQFGFGKVLVEKMEEEAVRLGKEGKGVVVDREGGGKGVKIKLHSQIQVILFYQRCGYECEGERFDEEGAPHQRMVKVLSI